MLKKSGTHEPAHLVLLVGGHTVAATLLAGQAEIAIYEALGVGTCFVIFLVLAELLSYTQKDNDKKK